MNDILSNFDKVKQLVSYDGLNLDFVADKYKDNNAIVAAAIKSNANALRFASERLRCDQHIVRMAVSRDGTTIRFAGNDLIDMDLGIQFAAIKNNPTAIKFLSNKCRDSFFVMHYVVLHDPDLYVFASARLRNTYNFCKYTIAQDPKTLRHMPFSMRDMDEVVYAAYIQNKEVICFASDRIKRQVCVV